MTAAIAGRPSASLYVGDLTNDTTEAVLFEVFNNVVPVASIRVCRDLVTRRSLGYAYVNFYSVEDASRAMETLNFSPIGGKNCRISWCHRDPSLRKSGVGNTFIKGLDKSIDNKSLYALFEKYGSILSCKVATDYNGESRGYGFVQFDTEEAASAAIAELNGSTQNGKEVTVTAFVRRAEREGGKSDSYTNLFVKNFGKEVDEKKLRETFEKFGVITSVVVMRDEGESGESKGFGFVNFEDPDAAAKAVESINQTRPACESDETKEWFVGRAQKKTERARELRAKFEKEREERAQKLQGVNLYVKNLPDGVADEKLRSLFVEFGTITSAKVMRNAAGDATGAGFVAFSDPAESNKAVVEMNGKMVEGKPLYVALAQRKEERRVQLQARFANRTMAAMPGMGPGMYPAPGPGGPGMMMAPGMMGPGMGPGPMMMGPGGPIPPGARVPGPYGMPGSGYMGMPGMPGMPGGGRGRGRGGRGGIRGVPAGGRGGARGGYPGMAMGRGGVPPMMMDPSMGAMPTAVMPPAPTAAQLNAAPPEQQRIMLGEALYPLVESIERDHAAKVTGMLLEMEKAEVLNLLESPEALSSRVQEAMEVLRQASSS